MTSFVEFYIACNPPLLPNGVEHMVQTVKKALPISHLVEILYESEVPWFKCISAIEHQRSVTEAVQNAMTQVVESETGLLDANMRANDSKNVLEWAPPPDVAILSPEPKITPWSLCDDTKALNTRLFDEFRFPDTTQNSCSVKDVWRDMESHPGLRLGQMLARLHTVWPQLAAYDEETQALQAILKCDISTNLATNLLYIGCQGQDVLDRAMQMLGTMLKASDALSTLKPHMVFTIDDSMRFTFRLLTTVGLSRMTYLNGGSSIPRKHYQVLKRAATLRNMKEDERGDWTPDSTVYPLFSDAELDSVKPFSALVDHVYPGKEPVIVVRLPPNQCVPNLMDEPITNEMFHENTPSSGTGSSRKTTVRGTMLPMMQQQDLIDLNEPVAKRPGTPQKVSCEAALQFLDEGEDLMQFDEVLSTTQHPHSYSKDLVFHANHETIIESGASKTAAVTYEPLLKLCESRLGEMAEILKLAYGYAGLELKLGRFYIHGIDTRGLQGSPCLSMELEEATEVMNKSNVDFSTILSTNGEDADAVAGAITNEGSKWVLATIETSYVFHSILTGTEFIVEIDADSFEYQCKLPEEDLAAICLHCPGHAWDMKGRAFRSQNLNKLAGHENFVDFAEDLVASLCVSTDETGELILRVNERIRDVGPETSNEAIGQVAVKQLVRYMNHPRGGSVLNITRYQNLDRIPTGSQHMAAFRTSDNNMKAKKVVPDSPGQWFEASISSAHLEEFLADNVDFQPTDVAAWNCEKLQSEGVFRAICETGFDIITQIDNIGRGNNNGLGKGVTTQTTGGVVGLHEPNKENISNGNAKFEFW